MGDGSGVEASVISPDPAELSIVSENSLTRLPDVGQDGSRAAPGASGLPVSGPPIFIPSEPLGRGVMVSRRRRRTTAGSESEPGAEN